MTDDTDQRRERAMTDDTDPRREARESDHTDPHGGASQVNPPQGNPSQAVPDERPEADAPPEGADDGETDVEKVRRYLLKGALVVLGLLGVVATIQFYSSATSAINILVADEFQPIFQAAFNLIVLLGVGLGIAFVVRELD